MNGLPDPSTDYDAYLAATHFKTPESGLPMLGEEDVGIAKRAGFSGVAYIAGHKITGLNSNASLPWVVCNLDTSQAVQHAGPPPDPFPPNQEWYAKATTAGDIHIPRA